MSRTITEPGVKPGFPDHETWLCMRTLTFCIFYAVFRSPTS